MTSAVLLNNTHRNESRYPICTISPFSTFLSTAEIWVKQYLPLNPMHQLISSRNFPTIFSHKGGSSRTKNEKWKLKARFALQLKGEPKLKVRDSLRGALTPSHRDLTLVGFPLLLSSLVRRCPLFPSGWPISIWWLSLLSPLSLPLLSTAFLSIFLCMLFL